MMEAAPTSETSVDIYLTTRQYVPQDSELHSCRRENLKAHEYERDSLLGYSDMTMEGMCISETSIYYSYTTGRPISKGYLLHTFVCVKIDIISKRKYLCLLRLSVKMNNNNKHEILWNSSNAKTSRVAA
jgi:hypothetical protein